MNELKFGWSGQGSLAQALNRPLTRISADFYYYGCNNITLWYSAQDGIKIQSSMHDIAVQLEVGVLEFASVTAASDDETFLDLPIDLLDASPTSKLVKSIVEEGVETRAESGLVLQSAAGRQLIITAAGHPCLLFMAGIDLPPQEVVPEYSLDDYERLPLLWRSST